jgi:hypothetical protein
LPDVCPFWDKCVSIDFSGPLVEKGFAVKEKPDLTNAVWRRSTRSDDDTSACVEVAVLSNGYAVRNSTDPEGPVLFFTQAEWDAFVGGAKDGEFDLE